MGSGQSAVGSEKRVTLRGDQQAKPPPKAHTPPMRHDGDISLYADGDLQLQTHADTIYGDWDEYIQA
jgi:hypothetical protein